MVSQVYVPDPAAVGQHMADAGAALVERGWRVRVLTSARGYDNPEERYSPREVIDGVDVQRLPFSSFGKKNLLVRFLGQGLFLLQAIIHGLFQRRLSAVVVTTVPVLSTLAGCLIAGLRRVPLVYWVMDLNPDQAVAMGVARSGSWPVRLLDALNRWILRKASCVIVLDRFMAQSLVKKEPRAAEKILVLPPWAPSEDEPSPQAGQAFRREHGLEGKRVVMYSGNHSLVHPLTTLLEAMEAFTEDARLVFVFVGGGRGKLEVERFVQRTGAGNVLLLPFQPLESLGESLSAAHVHVVSMGNNMVGCVHPCKGYGALALARPLLILGPAESPLADVVAGGDIGWQVCHGDVDTMRAVLTEIRDMPEEQLLRKGGAARAVAESRFSRKRLLEAWCDRVEEAIAGTSGQPEEKPDLAGTRR